MYRYEYRETDSCELKDLKRRHFRALCRIKNLESNIARVAPEGFDALMSELEIQMQKVEELSKAITLLRYKEAAEELTSRNF